MIIKRQLIMFVMVAALTVGGVLNLGTVGVSAVEPAGHIYISPAYVSVAGCSEIGSNYTFSICSNYTGTDVIGYAFKLTYDPTVLHGVNVTNGDVVTEAVNTTLWNSTGFDNIKGELGLTGANFFYLNPPPSTVNGTGILANVTFTVVGCGISNIDFVDDDETKLIGWDGSEEYIIIDRYLPEIGRLVGAVFDHSATHDIAIIDVSPNQTVVGQGFDVDINVTAQNQGQLPENFTVTAYYDTTVIKSENVTNLPGGNSTTLTFTWNTTGVSLGSYTIGANASIVAGETDTADNSYIDGTVTVTFPATVEITTINAYRCGVLVNEGYKTWTLNVNLTIHSNGTIPINCTVNAYYSNATGTYQIGTSQNVTNLPPCNYKTFTFSLDLLDLSEGFYTLKANATCTGGGSDEFVGSVLEKIPWGDVNGNGLVGFLDFGDVGKMYLIYSGVITDPPDLIARGDINGNCVVGSLDFGDVGKMYLIYSGVLS